VSLAVPLAERLVAVLTRHPRVELAILFGSLASGQARPDSDLDLAVGCASPLAPGEKAALIGDLAEALGRPVDLVDLYGVGEPLLGQILRHGRRILGSDERYARLLSRHLIEAADFVPYRSRILAERRRAWIGE
jgi:predicted nucleotidyltransferase